MGKSEVVTEFRKMTDKDTHGRAIDSGLYKSRLSHAWWHDLKYLLAGAWFGLLLVKSEVISWFRIQEMFRLQSFHMYGVIGSAVLVGMLSLWVIRKFGIRTIYGEPIVVADKK